MMNKEMPTIQAIQTAVRVERKRQKLLRFEKVSAKISRGEPISINSVMTEWAKDRSAIFKRFENKVHFLYSRIFELESERDDLKKKLGV